MTIISFLVCLSVKLGNNLKHAFRSLRVKFILLTAFSVFIPMAVTGMYLYVIIRDNIVDRTNTDISLFIQQINENVSAQFKTIDDITGLLLSNRIIREVLQDPQDQSDDYSKYIAKNSIETEISYCMLYNNSSPSSSNWAHSIITRIYLFKSNSVFFKESMAYLLNEEQCDKLHQYFYTLSDASKAERSIFLNPARDQTLYLQCTVKNPDTTKSIGRLFLDINEKVVSMPYSNLSKYEGSQWYLIDSQGNILSHPDKSMIGKKIDRNIIKNSSSSLTETTINGTTYIYSYKVVGSYNISSIVLIPKNQIFLNFTKYIINYFYIIFVIIIFSLLIGLRYTYRFTKPLKDLSDKIELVGEGNFDVKMPSYTQIELDKLGMVFNKMTEKMDYLIKDVYQKQLLLKESELKSLHSQMNPHFMFNVLATIGLQAKMSNNETIYKMVNSFSQLLRANITLFDNQKIPLSEELKYINFYLYLQNIRYDGKIHYKINVEDDSVYNLLIPKFSIQPLIENAVVHGLESKDYEGTVLLNIWRESDVLNLEVIDDGIGFETEDIDLNIENSQLTRKEGHNNIGIQNINKRIKLLYGEGFGLFVQSMQGKGSKVIIKIRVDKGGDLNGQNNDC